MLWLFTPTGSPADDPGVTTLWLTDDEDVDAVDDVGLLNVAGLLRRPRDMKNFSMRPRWPPCGLLKLRHVVDAAGAAILPNAVVALP